MDLRKALVCLPVVALLAIVKIGLSQTTYEDPQGRFVIDLPEGWIYKPVLTGIFRNEMVADFDAEGKNFSVAFNPGISDPDRLIRHVANQFRFLQVEFDGDIVEMAVNGHSARWGTLKTALDPGMVVLCGSMELGLDGIFFFFTIRVADLPRFKERIEKTFQSIRLPGEALTGAGDVKSVKPPPAAPKVPTPWKGDRIGLTLPPGWVERPMPRNFEEQVKGWFVFLPIEGVTFYVVGYRGMGMTLEKAYAQGKNTVLAGMPRGRPIEDDVTRIENGKAYYAVYKGPVASQGKEVDVASVLITLKADHYFANLIVTGQAIYLDELKAQILEIAKTVK